MDYVLAFVTGGAICALVQLLMEKTKLMPGRIMVLLVCTGAAISAIGLYEPFSEWAGAGANVPLLGFGNVLFRGSRHAGLLRNLPRRFQSRSCRNKRSVDIRLHCVADSESEDEKIV